MSTMDVSVDDSGVVRILDSEKFAQTEKLQEDAAVFLNKIGDFFTIARGIVEEVNTQAKYIERQKLRAIGERNLIEIEREKRRKEKQDLDGLIAERQLELERLTRELESIQKVEREQQALISKLGSAE